MTAPITKSVPVRTAEDLFAEATRMIQLRALDQAGMLERMRWPHPTIPNLRTGLTPSELADLRRRMSETAP
jgi:hypothetical protein